jgi:2-hydroxychromene-2-carboxylate isomerase
MAIVDFWFDFASTYSYVAAMRVEEEAERAGVTVRWRSFLLGPIFAAKGLRDSPFNLDPVKGAYMWRDLERLCARHGLAWRRPSAFPRNSIPAARVAAAFADEPWLPAFTRAVFRLNFAEDAAIDDPDGLEFAVVDAGGPADAAARAQEAPLKSALRVANDEATARGVFGAPSFTIGGPPDAELFWGGDRLTDALDWAAQH